MFNGQDDMEMVECPYNKSHRMLRKRLQSHLIKCRVNHTDAELQRCPFNNTHLIPEPEFLHHVTNCSDRKLIVQYKYTAAVVKDEDRPKQAPVETNENWDDTEVEDYNPLKFATKTCVLRRPNIVSSSERKAFIKIENQKFDDNSSDEDDSPQKPPTPPPPQWNEAKPSKTRNDRHRSRSPNVYRASDTQQSKSTKCIKARYSPEYSLDNDPYYTGNHEDSNQHNNPWVIDTKGNLFNDRHSVHNSPRKINLPSCTRAEDSGNED